MKAILHDWTDDDAGDPGEHPQVDRARRQPASAEKRSAATLFVRHRSADRPRVSIVEALPA
jgi:hypothetical protein